MSATISSDLATFHAFVGQQLAAGNSKLTPEESVAAYRDFLRQRSELQRMLQAATEQFERGEGTELDHEQLKREVVAKLAARGIRD